jgi:ATP-dependent exoDNAse (exonuclease V) alpha subunit
MPIVLTAEQRSAVAHLLDFPEEVQTLGGYAGTGKTTVITELHRRLPYFPVCAFTGKAASVLRRKGVEASTIHSLIFKAVEIVSYDKKGKRRVHVEYVQKPSHEVLGRGFIVDEASMVGRDLHDALTAYGRPVIFVGDHGQLEPVQSEDFNLMAAPHVTLETVHRNAGEIARFAEFLREGSAPTDWNGHPGAAGEVLFVEIQKVEGLPDQNICAFNRTRVDLNRCLREALGYPEDRPVIGDRVMCLQNDHQLGVYNGMQGVVKAVAGDELVFSAGADYRVRFVPEQFNCESRPAERHRDRLPFDYAYTVTCHKAQGDEWDEVLVVEQPGGRWDRCRWNYTAASRARRRLLWATS